MCTLRPHGLPLPKVVRELVKLVCDISQLTNVGLIVDSDWRWQADSEQRVVSDQGDKQTLTLPGGGKRRDERNRRNRRERRSKDKEAFLTGTAHSDC